MSLTVTDSNGKTSTTTQTLTVTSSTPSSIVEFIITTPPSATAGSSFSAIVTARDESGNLLTNYAGTLTFTSSDGQAILPASFYSYLWHRNFPYHIEDCRLRDNYRKRWDSDQHKWTHNLLTQLRFKTRLYSRRKPVDNY